MTGPEARRGWGPRWLLVHFEFGEPVALAIAVLEDAISDGVAHSILNDVIFDPGVPNEDRAHPVERTGLDAVHPAGFVGQRELGRDGLGSPLHGANRDVDFFEREHPLAVVKAPHVEPVHVGIEFDANGIEPELVEFAAEVVPAIELVPVLIFPESHKSEPEKSFVEDTLI